MLAKSIMIIPITEVFDFSSSPICGSLEVFACFSAETFARSSVETANCFVAFSAF